MMITPAMMEQLGGKRGKPRGPDMTNVVITETAAADDFDGASTLEASLGDWDDGRKKKKKKDKSKTKSNHDGTAAQLESFDASYAAFRVGNERLQVTADAVQAYIEGLQHLCEGHDLVATRMMEALGQIDTLAAAVHEYHDMSSWSRTADPNSKASRMQEMMETLVHDPIECHLKTRQELAARMGRAKKKEQAQLMDEMKTFEESLPNVMNKPFEALRRMQIEFMSTAARATAGGADPGLGDISISTAMTDRGRGLTGKTGFTPRPGAHTEGAVSEGVPPEARALVEGVPEARQTKEDIWSNITAQRWDGPAIDTKLLGSTPCLGLFAQLGWRDAQPTLFVALKNSSTLEISGICVEVVHSTALQVSCKKPLGVAKLAPGAEKRVCATLVLGGAAAASSEDEFDSFFGERDAVTTLDDDATASNPRGVESWAVDPTCTSVSSITIKVSNSLEVTTVDVALPYHLFLKGHSKLRWAEFVELWNSPEPAPEPQSRADELEPDDGTTNIRVRIEDPPEIIGYTRFDPDTNLDVMRQMLLADPALKRKLPAEWVFVKKGAPVGKKAETKWRVADIVPNAVIRDKSRPPLDEDTLQARASMSSPTPADRTTPVQKEPIPERVFTCPCGETEARVASALAVGGVILVGRLEEGKRDALLLFFARASVDVYFLLQVSCASGETAGSCTCTVRGPNTALFDVFEKCVRALLSTTFGIVEIQEIRGAGQSYYGNFGGVSFEDAQDGRGNDDGCEYHDYGDTSVEQTIFDWLASHGHESEVEGTCAALLEAGIAKDEWLQELIGIKQDGVLDQFIRSVSHHEEKKSRSAPSENGTGGYDYGDYGGASLEEALGGAGGYDYGDYGGATLEDALGDGFERGGDDDENRYDFGDYGGVSLEDALGGGDDWGGFRDSSAGGSGGSSLDRSAPPSPMNKGEADDMFDADFAAFDDGDGFGAARTGGGRTLTQNSSSRSLMSDGATPESEAAFGVFEADFGDPAGPALDVSLQRGPDSHVFDPDFIAEAAKSNGSSAGGLPRSGLGSYDAVWAAEQRPGFRSGRRGSTDSAGSHGSCRSSGSHRSSVSSRSRPMSAPGTPKRITMIAGSGTIEQLEALSAVPVSHDGADEIGRDFDEDTSFYDEVSRTDISASRGSPTVSDYD